MFQKITQTKIYVACMMVIVSVVCFLALGKNSFSMDEVSTITISQNWPTMWHLLWTQEGNMWFYSLLMHFWLHFGSQEWVVRSFSALCGVLTIPVFFGLAKNLFSEKIAKIATPLFIVNLCFVYFAQTARTYSLSLLLTTLSCYLFLKILKKTPSRIIFPLYIFVCILAIYTYLFALFIIVIQYLSLFFSPEKISWKKTVLVFSLMTIGVIPLFASPSLRGGHQLDWLSKPAFIQLPFSVLALSGDSVVVGAMMCFILALFLWKKKNILFSLKSFEKFRFVWLILWFGLPILSTFIFSLVIKPIYQPQYFNTSLPAFILLVSMGLVEIPVKKQIKKILYIALIVFSLIRLGLWYTGSNHNQIIFANTNPWDWRNVAHYVLANGKSTDAIIFYAYYIKNPFEHYFALEQGSQKPKILEIASGEYALGGGYVLPEENIALLKNLSKTYPRVWFVSAYTNTSVQQRNQEWGEIEKVLESTYVQNKTIHFNQINVELFQKR